MMTELYRIPITTKPWNEDGVYRKGPYRAAISQHEPEYFSVALYHVDVCLNVANGFKSVRLAREWAEQRIEEEIKSWSK